MRSFEQTCNALEALHNDELSKQREFKKLGNELLEQLDRGSSPMPTLLERRKQLSAQIEEIQRQKLQLLEEFLRYPPHHDRHFSKLQTLLGKPDYAYDKLVFIMTKYPEGDDEPAKQLGNIIKVVQDTVTECGYVPRRANDEEIHDLLWDNVELYLLSSSRAIAILEDTYRPELNPNVAMEWGWMRGMGRKVFALVERNFKSQRADWEGLIKHEFEWSRPDAGIQTAVKNWLKNSGV